MDENLLPNADLASVEAKHKHNKMGNIFSKKHLSCSFFSAFQLPCTLPLPHHYHYP